MFQELANGGGLEPFPTIKAKSCLAGCHKENWIIANIMDAQNSIPSGFYYDFCFLWYKLLIMSRFILEEFNLRIWLGIL